MPGVGLGWPGSRGSARRSSSRSSGDALRAPGCLPQLRKPEKPRLSDVLNGDYTRFCGFWTLFGRCAASR